MKKITVKIVFSNIEKILIFPVLQHLCKYNLYVFDVIITGTFSLIPNTTYL